MCVCMGVGLGFFGNFNDKWMNLSNRLFKTCYVLESDEMDVSR